jgi:6-phosphogluconolactonase
MRQANPLQKEGSPSPVMLHDTRAELCRGLAAEILGLADRCIARNRKFSIVLTGGNTIRDVYPQLASASSDWRHWQIFWGDERCVPPGHPDRNSREARASWLDHVAIPSGAIHEVPAEKGADDGAREYSKLLEGAGMFDLVLLSLGEDGHVASLFPGSAVGLGLDAPAAVAIHYAPKLPAERVSLSAQRLAQTQSLWVLAAGKAKREALHACLHEDSWLRRAFGTSPTFFVDREAWHQGMTNP